MMSRLPRLSIVLACVAVGHGVAGCKEPPPPPEPVANASNANPALAQQPGSKQQLLAYVPTYLATRPGCETVKVRLLDERPAGLGAADALDGKTPPLLSYFEAICADEICYGEYRYGKGDSRIAHVCSADPSSCKDNDPAACARVAWDFPIDQSPGDWRAKYLGKACDGGERSACLEAANHETFRRDYPGKQKRLQELYGRGCVLADHTACDFWSKSTKASAYQWSAPAKIAAATVRVGTVAIPTDRAAPPRYFTIEATAKDVSPRVNKSIMKWSVEARCGSQDRTLWLTGKVAKTGKANTMLWMLPMASAGDMIGPPCELRFKAKSAAGAPAQAVGHGCWAKHKLTPGRCAVSTWPSDSRSETSARVANMRFAYESRRPEGPNISDQYWYDLALGYAITLGPGSGRGGLAAQYSVRGRCGEGAQRVDIEQSFSMAADLNGELLDGELRQKLRRRATKCSFEWVTRHNDHVFQQACFRNGKLTEGACR